MAGMDDGSLVGFVRGIIGRQKAAKIEDAQRNYMNDPQAAIAAVNEVHGGGPEAAYNLQQRYKQDQASDQATQLAAQQRYLGSVRNMATMLSTAHKQGQDIGAAFDGLMPTLKKGFGMTDEDIANYRAQFTANPELADALRADADAKLMNLTPGAEAFDPNSGSVVHRNPAAPKVVQVPRGDGGRDVFVQDPNTGEFVTPGAGGGFAPGNGGMPSGPLDVDAVAPHVIAQESGGDYTALNNDTGAMGAYQLMPATAKSLADRMGVPWNPGLMTSNTAQGRQYQDILGRAAVAEAAKASGGDPEVFGQYYHGGSDRNKWGPKTKQYGSEMAARITGSGGMTPIYSSAGKSPKGGRMATAADKQTLGLDADTPYWIDDTGKPNKVGERPMGGQRKLGNATPGMVTDYYDTVKGMKAEAERLLNSPDLDRAVGPIQGRFAGLYDKRASGFQTALGSLGARLLVQTLSKLKQLSSTGASGFGNFSNKEGDVLREQQGTLDVHSSEDEIRRSLRNIVNWSDDQLGAMPDFGKVPKEAVRDLRQNPKSRSQFDEVFGPGMADFYLGSAKK